MLEQAYSYGQFKAQVLELGGRFRRISTAVQGRSVLGKAIFSLSLGDGLEYVILAGGFHGQEWIGTAVIMRFMLELCESLEAGDGMCGIDPSKLLRGRRILAVPCVNPDGLEIARTGGAVSGYRLESIDRIARGDFSRWNANARGVDINHNFDAGWKKLREEELKAGINGPSPGKYGGPAPESEPETRVLTRLCNSLPVCRVYAFHSQGEEIYCEYGENTPPESYAMACAYGALTGYRVCMPSGTASHGGFKDWFIEKFGRPGFTFEVGKGTNPLPCDALDEVYEKLKAAMLISIAL